MVGYYQYLLRQANDHQTKPSGPLRVGFSLRVYGACTQLAKASSDTVAQESGSVNR